jgi:hypothetical protein
MDEASRLNALRETISLQKSRDSGTKFLHVAPAMRKKRSVEESSHSHSHSTFPSTSRGNARVTPSSRTPQPPPIDRRERLRQIEIEKKEKEGNERLNDNKPAAKAPVLIKMTKKSRSDMLLETVETTLKQPMEPIRKASAVVVPMPVASQPNVEVVMPLQRIIQGMESNRLSQVMEQPRRPANAGQRKSPEPPRRNSMQLQHKHNAFPEAEPAIDVTVPAVVPPSQVRTHFREQAHSLGPPPVVLSNGQTIQPPRPTEPTLNTRAPGPGPSHVPAPPPVMQQRAQNTAQSIVTRSHNITYYL